ncbi:aspartyl/glutamyl-tRNA amidotransferase subunit C [Entomoplasma ellychniae]|uniref:Aspartyl/glutamyl-tRNA amidotransferase subunit C n=2 Tax=Entomoplasmataceae TaxID=33925 RepID=A0A2S5RH17_9MOLU|nr:MULTISPECIES: Asp-tRNA(Asn)/Glu-tRNA(Gln) amidotransferase subunit GatC [Entomoplasmataceae]PPE04957.1 aspartyl/glutamyl-tRNA amidotransferase subunit C [Entomoplasma ellychniae]PPE06512.1 aspartyl/glutamyl-tRNA amidotransferase subunit C [Mesoplasma corruscae]
MEKKDYYKSLANDVMLDFDNNHYDDIDKNYAELKELFKKVTSIDTEGVKPLFYPYDDIHTYLRDDEFIQTMNQEDILKNAPSTDGDFVTLVKVVK